ncbi:MAG: TonB-dependent receptor [Pseudomonadales bacterium]
MTAQKREQSMQDVGISVTAMSGDNMRSLGVSSSADIAGFTPNLQIISATGEGNQPTLFLRGVGLNDYNTNNAGPIGMYMDEVIISTPSAQAFAMFDSERVEVLRGPQGTLYGRNTTGGAINVISRKPGEEFEGDVLTSYGNFDALRLEGAVGGPISDTLGFRVAGVYNEADGYVDDVSSGEEYNETDNYAVRALLQWDPSDTLSALFNFHYGKNDTRAPRYIHYGLLEADSFDPNLGIFTDLCSDADISAQAPNCVSALGYQDPTGDDREGEWNNDGTLNFDVTGASVKLDWDLSDNISLVSITAYDEVDKIHEEDSDSGPDNWLEVSFGVDSETFSQELRLVGDNEKSNWLLGLFYLDETLNQDQTADLFRDLRPDFGFDPDLSIFFSQHLHEQDTTTWAAYGQFEYEFSDKWLATVGLRYTYEERDFTANVSFVEPDFTVPLFVFNEKIDNDNVSGRLALNFFPNEDWMIYGSLTSGFKSGGFPGGLVFTPEEYGAYDEETIIAYELGFKSTLAGGLVQLNGAAFFYDYQDIQVYQVLPGDSAVPQQKLDNAGDAEIYGGELELVATPTDGLYLMLGVGYTHTEFLDLQFGDLDLRGNQLANTPEWTANGIVRYDWDLDSGGGLYVQGDFTYSDEYFFDVFNTAYASQDSYTLFGARAGYQATSGNWEVNLWGKNLGDEDYSSWGLDLGSGFGLLQVMPTKSRTYGVELRAFF